MNSSSPIRWGIIGCGNVTEVKSGPGLQKATDSSLVAVMRRDGAAARDYARRHNVPRAYTDATDLIEDSDVDASLRGYAAFVASRLRPASTSYR